LLETALEVRNSEEFSGVFTADPQVPGVDAIKGSEMIFPVIFRTLPTKQYAPVREFRRRVRLALEERHLLPGDPLRVFSGFDEAQTVGRPMIAQKTPPHDPTATPPAVGSLFGNP
jgi:small conductance mechanosensitive channel